MTLWHGFGLQHGVDKNIASVSTIHKATCGKALLLNCALAYNDTCILIDFVFFPIILFQAKSLLLADLRTFRSPAQTSRGPSFSPPCPCKGCVLSRATNAFQQRRVPLPIMLCAFFFPGGHAFSAFFLLGVYAFTVLSCLCGFPSKCPS